MLPFVRAFISIVAGLVRVPAIRFGVLSLIGTVIYATALSSAGYALGSAWNSVSHGLAIVGYILFVIVVIAIVGFVVYRLRQFRREAQAAREAQSAGRPSCAATRRAPAPWTRHRARRSGPSRGRTGPVSQRISQTPRSASSNAAVGWLRR